MDGKNNKPINRILSSDDLELWPHQSLALKRMRQYLEDYKQKKTTGSALVHMPTGSGKTRVISTLARFTPGVDCVLILAPRIALRQQLVKKLDERIILKRDIENVVLPKRVYEWVENYPSDSPGYILNDFQSENDNLVIVSTIQMLDSTKKHYEEIYSFLQDHVSLVLIDEGHYEPAISWGRTIRGLSTAKILFTATPYRNDFKAFDIDIDYRYSFTYQEALEHNYLRKVNVKTLPSTTDPNQLVSDIKNEYRAFFGFDIPKRPMLDTPRIIIRCDRSSSMRMVITALQEAGLVSLIAIHERFDDRLGPPHERQSVPVELLRSEMSPLIWIHQYKLLEGIDDPRFQILAFFGPLNRNTRSLIQQVGRVIRNKSQAQPEIALILDHTGGKLAKVWEAFVSFDKKLARKKGNEDGAGAALQSIGESFVKEYIKLHPEPVYIDRKFRNRFVLSNQNPITELTFPLSVNIIEKLSNFNLLKFLEAIEQKFDESDRVYKRYDIKDTFVYSHISYSNSAFLKNQYLLQCAHGITFIKEYDRYIAFYDSIGFVPVNVSELGLAKGVSPKHLQKLYQKADKSKLTRVSFKNSYLQYRAIRTRSISAASIELTVPFLDDHAHVLSNSLGYSEDKSFKLVPYKTKETSEIDEDETDIDEETTKEKELDTAQVVRRYVGFTTGKITQSYEMFDFEDYIQWVDQIINILSSNIEPISTFSRWAVNIPNVKDPTPRNILLDLFDVEDIYRTSGGGNAKKEAMDIASVCYDVTLIEDETEKRRALKKYKKDRVFIVRANGRDCKVYISYLKDKKKYELASDSLDGLYSRYQPNLNRSVDAFSIEYPVEENESLIDYLNRTQSFRVLPETDGVAYVNGQFYQPTQKFGREFDPDHSHIIRILEPKKILNGMNVEVGNFLPDHSGWRGNSLFALVSNLGKGYGMQEEFGTPDILICDHGQKEIADFIMVNREAGNNRVVFIHAKTCETRAPYGATGLSKVCPQAIKNIHYLSMFENLTVPPSVRTWKNKLYEPSDLPLENKNYIHSRILLPKKYNESSSKLWNEIHSIIRDPKTNCEVWLLLGNMWSKAEVINRLQSSSPTKEAIQGAILLQGTLAAVGSIHGNLRVFCMP
jgi:superfamily II DNA or RNA helicase